MLGCRYAIDLAEAGLSFGKFVASIILIIHDLRVCQMGDILTQVLVGYPQAGIEVQGLKYADHIR